MDLPVPDPELIGAYASNAVFIGGSLIAAPFAYLGDLVTYITGLLP
ncbi:MAG: hypothetical protein ACTH1D_02935 [Mycobacteriaceae bacterium]